MVLGLVVDVIFSGTSEYVLKSERNNSGYSCLLYDKNQL
jgi:hypothetical protein